MGTRERNGDEDRRHVETGFVATGGIVAMVRLGGEERVRGDKRYGKKSNTTKSTTLRNGTVFL
jgi:hypothetical protein